MSRQTVMNRRGKPIGYIETGRDGHQSAMTPRGAVVATFDPRVGETYQPCGTMLAEGNLLTKLLLQHV